MKILPKFLFKCRSIAEAGRATGGNSKTFPLFLGLKDNGIRDEFPQWDNRMQNERTKKSFLTEDTYHRPQTQPPFLARQTANPSHFPGDKHMFS